MKLAITTFLLMSPMAALAITCGPIQPNGAIAPPSEDGVVPEYCDNWITGDAGQECVVNLGYDFGLKIDEPGIPDDSVSGACDGQGSCSLAPEFNNVIFTSKNTGSSFTFSAEVFPLGAVVVKGGPNANVYTYDPPAVSDGLLTPPINTSGVPFNISHISFCWNDPNTEQCYEEETAWAVGDRYTQRGNWAMYVDSAACGLLPCEYLLRADGGDGVGTIVGRASLNSNGDGTNTISIALEGGAIFYYDLGSMEADENLKVQSYDVAPSGNPKVGLFANKLTVPVGETSAAIVVPEANFYGIHLDVAVPVACE